MLNNNLMFRNQFIKAKIQLIWASWARGNLHAICDFQQALRRSKGKGE